MKKYIFLKQSPSIQLAHLYEHIVCIKLGMILQDKKMYLYSDYSLSAKTYYGGMICIEYTQFKNNYHVNFKRILSNLEINFKEDITNIAISQIVIEKKSLLHSNGYDSVILELTKLHNKRWLDIDNFEFYNAKEIRRKTSPLYLAEGKVPKIKNLTICIKLDMKLNKDNQILVPLFRQVAYLLLLNLETSVCDYYGTFGAGITIKNNKQINFSNNIKFVNNNFELDNNLISFIKNQIILIIEDGALERLSNNLASMSYKSNPEKTVDIQNNYEDTLFIIGSKGWKKVSTKKNIDLLIANSFLEIKLGKISKKIPILFKTFDKN